MSEEMQVITDEAGWVVVPPKHTSLKGVAAIRLYASDSIHLGISLEAWEAMGLPEAVEIALKRRPEFSITPGEIVISGPMERAILINPPCILALRPVPAHQGFKVHACDTRHTGAIDRTFINAAKSLRKALRRSGYRWPCVTSILPLTQQGDRWIAEIPQGEE